jgi:hypothetical protein
MSASYPLQATDVTLAETLDRVLDTGAVLRGDIVISVANVDLLYLDIRLLLSAVDTALRNGAIDEHALSRYPSSSTVSARDD